MASSPLPASCKGWVHAAFSRAAYMSTRSFSLSSTNKKVVPSFINLRGLAQLEPKMTALAGGGHHAHAPAHALHRLLDNRQADTRARMLFSVQAGEQAEDLALVVGGDAGAVVFHPDADIPGLFLRSQPHHGRH